MAEIKITCPNCFNDKQCFEDKLEIEDFSSCLLYTSPSPRDPKISRMPSSA